MSRIVRSAVALGLGVVLSLTAVSCLDLEPTRFIDYYGPNKDAPPSIVGTDVVLPEATSQATSSSAPATMAVISGEPLKLGVNEAILASLENNQSFAVQRYLPRISYTFMDNERAVFDPVLAGQVQGQRTKTPFLRSGGTGGRTLDTDDAQWAGLNSLSSSLGVTQYWPTGTTVAITGGTDLFYPSGPLTDNSSLELNITQKILRGGGIDVNLASLRQAKLDFEASQYDLRGFAEALVAQVEQTYWNYALAIQQIRVFEDSLALAEQSLNEVRERVKVGKLAETQMAAAESEVALRNEALIVARANLQTTRLNLLRLVNPSVGNLWERQIALKDEPVVPNLQLPDVENYAQVAMQLRPDLNQARLQVQRGDLELVKTRNGLLPQLDVFATLGKTGYANSFGPSVGNIFKEQGYNAAVGFTGSYPPLNRDAIATNQRAVFNRDQSVVAVSNLEQLAQVDVRTAYIVVVRSREEITATAATVRAQQETLRAETEKFREGKSTTFQVAQAQRDLVQSQIANLQTIVNHLNALVDLYRLDGSLLIRRGIAAPGNKPVAMTKKTVNGGQ